MIARCTSVIISVEINEKNNGIPKLFVFAGPKNNVESMFCINDIINIVRVHFELKNNFQMKFADVCTFVLGHIFNAQ